MVPSAYDHVPYGPGFPKEKNQLALALQQGPVLYFGGVAGTVQRCREEWLKAAPQSQLARVRVIEVGPNTLLKDEIEAANRSYRQGEWIVISVHLGDGSAPRSESEVNLWCKTAFGNNFCDQGAEDAHNSNVWQLFIGNKVNLKGEWVQQILARVARWNFSFVRHVPEQLAREIDRIRKAANGVEFDSAGDLIWQPLGQHMTRMEKQASGALPMREYEGKSLTIDDLLGLDLEGKLDAER